ncbi:MAG: sulfatase-like hydrolase/transferase [bacterium]|nr:sulfatase-like hydrolase/transferase [bacterium]
MNLIPQTLAVSLFAALTLTSAGSTGGDESPGAPSPPPAPPGPGAAARPNVFLIVIDTVRADHLSSYGYDRRTSPHIDRLAKEGVLYEDCISASSWTLPAHASLFTGLFPRDHHTTSENWTLDESYDTLAELLREAGYHTGGFSNNVWTNDVSGLKRGFDTFREMWREQADRKRGISFDDPTDDMGAAKTNEEIFAWLDGLPDKNRPFFVFINYFEPHLPYRPTRPHDADFLAKGVDQGTIRRLRSFYSPREYGYILDVPWMKVSAKEIEILTALYDGEIAYVDSIIDQLVKGLGSRDLLDDTLLVITSDHGEHLGEHHMLGHKLSVYDPLLRVPLILWNPGRIPAGVRITTQVQAHDVFGTILDVTGVRDGVLPRLPFEDRAHDYTFAELAYPRIFLEVIAKEIPGWDAGAFARSLKAVRGQRYKLIWSSDERPELYDVVDDPDESRNLAGTQPAVLEKMQKVLESFNNGTLPGKR